MGEFKKILIPHKTLSLRNFVWKLKSNIPFTKTLRASKLSQVPCPSNT